MKQRIITGVILILILIPIFITKMVYDINHFIYILGFILTVIAMNEMIGMKESEKKLPFVVHVLAYLTVIYLSFSDSFVELFNMSSKYQIDILPYVVILLTLFMVMCKNFKINDASFMLFTMFYIGLAFKTLVNLFLKVDGMYELLYIVLIAMFTDTFAYFVGTFFGKHKLCPGISPKKTIEGSAGGTIFATILATVYFILIDRFTLPYNNLLFVVGFTLVLSVLSQFGDLAASVIKRHFKVKDYGNLFPGHGGVLDRLDSILFTSLTYFYLTELISRLF